MSDSKRTISLITRIAVGVLLLALAIGGMRILVNTQPVAQRKDDVAVPRAVRVIEAKQLPVRRQWRGYGAAQARDTSDVPARLTATVNHIPESVQAGRTINKGELIAQLDDSDFAGEVEIITQNIADIDAQLSQIDVERKRLGERAKLEEGDVALANAKLERTRTSFDRGAANQTDLDDAKRQMIAAERSQNVTRESLDRLDPRRAQLLAQRAAREASLKIARQNVERCRIVSPITGVLEAVDVEAGESLLAGQRVARVVDLAAMEVPLRLPASARQQLDLRDEVNLQATNESGLSWQATVARIAPVDDADARTVTVYVEVRQPAANSEFTSDTQSRLLLPGMFVAGVVTHGKSEQRWVIPRRSVRSDRIMVVDDGIVSSRRVKVDYMLDGQFVTSELNDDQWAVLDPAGDPLTAGKHIIVDGGLTLLDGERVTPEVVHITSTSATQSPAARPESAEEVAP